MGALHFSHYVHVVDLSKYHLHLLSSREETYHILNINSRVDILKEVLLHHPNLSLEILRYLER